VNQNKTYKYEVPGGFLWSPLKNANGARNPFYDNMDKVEPGDMVFAYAHQQLKAMGIAQKHAYSAPKPASFENSSNNWSQIGWLVEVEFIQLADPVVPKEHLEKIGHYLTAKSAPLDETGRGKERYLVELDEGLALALIEISKAPLELMARELAPMLNADSDYEIELEIHAKHLEGDPEKIQLTKSRRGQGIFKANVRLVEDHCRVTGVTNIKHLRASHIKPWSVSSKEEKLDGFNGLLLSPHVDHLFDRGFISFKNSGDLLVSKELNPIVLHQWSISNSSNVGSFKSNQSRYLEFHRDVVFQK
jgi:putative restriction endonuclease